jgi:hypothetical protein
MKQKREKIEAIKKMADAKAEPLSEQELNYMKRHNATAHRSPVLIFDDSSESDRQTARRLAGKFGLPIINFCE